MHGTPERFLSFPGHVYPKLMELIPEEGDGLQVSAPTKEALEKMEMQMESAKPPVGRRNTQMVRKKGVKTAS